MSSSNEKYVVEAKLREQVDDLRNKIADKAHDLVNVVMPQRVLLLSDLYANTPELNLELDKIHSPIEIGTETEHNQDGGGGGEHKKRKTLGGESVNAGHNSHLVPSNKVILDLIAIIKGHVLELIETINCVKIWIQLNIPKIEDGNNFGVSIQEETVGELGRAEDCGYVLLENLSKYFMARAKLVSKVLKYPSIQDYRKGVEELDEKEYVNLKLSCLDLRNNYAILYDMITKNMDKIRTPRGSSHLHSMF